MDRDDVLQHLYQVFHGDLPSCGCGDPHGVIELVYKLLRLMPLHENQRWRQAEKLVGTEIATELVLHTLTGVYLIEHGSNVRGSWLDDKGKWVLWAVEQVEGGITNLGSLFDEGVGFPHNRADSETCTDACWVVPTDWELPMPGLVKLGEYRKQTVECPGPTCSRYLYGTNHTHEVFVLPLEEAMEEE